MRRKPAKHGSHFTVFRAFGLLRHPRKEEGVNVIIVLCGVQAVGGGVPREHEQRGDGAMAADLGGPRPGEHLVHPGPAGLRVPHHRVQLAGGQDTRREARTAR